MAKNHIKRIAAPKTWRILRKDTVFISRPKPGAHKLDLSISLNSFLKEMSGLTKTLKETKNLLTTQEVLVNGKRKRDHKAHTGFLDVVSVPSMKKTFRIIIDKKGKLLAKEISESDKNKLLLKITGKSTITGGKVQLNTMQSQNILVDQKEAKTYKTGDSVVYDLTTKKILNHLSVQKGMFALIYTGKHSGKTGIVEEITQNIVRIKTKTESFETNKEYSIIIGKEKPIIELD